MLPRQFTVRVWIALAIALVITVAFVVSWLGIIVMLMLFGGGLFAIFTRGISNWISAHSALGPRIAIAIVLLAMGAALALAGWFLAPSALGKLQQISEQIPALRAKIAQTEFGGLLLNFPGAESLLSGSGTLTSRMFQMISAGIVSPLFAGMAAIIGVYLAIQPALYKEGVVRLFPIPHRERAREVLDYTIYNLRWWVVSKAIGMVFVGVFVGIGLWIIGIPMPFTLGVVAGLLDFIPNIGAILSVVPAGLLALMQEPFLLVWVVIIYTAAHSIDNYIILPLLQLHFIRLPPALTLAAQLVLGFLVGPLGLIFAAPLAALFMTLAKTVYLQDVLGEPAETQP